MDNAFPQSITVDLGAAKNAGRLVLKPPPAAAWQTRTQTLSVSGSTDNSAYTSLKASAGVTLNRSSDNTASVTLPGTATRYARVTVTGNTGRPAAQLSELEVYAD